MLFFDDLQWIDSASLIILEDLMMFSGIRNLLLIGAFRSNEVAKEHPLIATFKSFRKRKVPITSISLKPLSRSHLGRLIADSLGSSPVQAETLIGLVYDKTNGNPFFAVHFLIALKDERLLEYDAKSSSWRWDMEQILSRGLTDNVVELMVAKLQKLPKPHQRRLMDMACLGNMVPNSLISQLNDTSADDQALTGFLLRQGTALKFVHDRVQEAAYKMIPAQDRPGAHLNIARRLLEQMNEVQLEEFIYDVVGQFNRGIDLIAPFEEEWVYQLNWQAARKAKEAGSYVAARSYFAQAVQLLPPDSWERHFEDTFHLHADYAACEFLLGHHDAADLLFSTLLSYARSKPERAQIYRQRISLYQVAGRFDVAVDCALEALAHFGIVFPTDSVSIANAVADAKRQVDSHLRQCAPQGLLDAPVAIDVNVRAILGILGDAMPCAFFARPPLYPLFILTALHLTVTEGNTQESCAAYMGYAILLASLYKDVEYAFVFSNLAIKLKDRFKHVAIEGTLISRHGLFINSHKNPIASSLDIHDAAFKSCVAVGNLVYAGYSALDMCWLTLEKGEPLDAVRQIVAKHEIFAQQSRHEGLHQTLLALLNFIDGMQTGSNRPQEANNVLDSLVKASFGAGVAEFHLLRQIAAIIYDRPSEALAHGRNVAPVIISVMGWVAESSYHFYNALAIVGECRNNPPGLIEQHRPQLDQHLAMLKDCPEPYASRFALLQAEIAGLDGRDSDAMAKYQRAIDHARAIGFLHLYALACERAAAFYASRSLTLAAQAHLIQAREAYEKWGAKAKVRQLDRRHPDLIPHKESAADVEIQPRMQDLDLLGVLKMSHAVSSEIVLDNLIETMLRLVLEHAGAERGLILLVKNKQLAIVAEAATSSQGIAVIRRPWDAPKDSDAPLTLVQFVVDSQRQTLLDDIRSDQRFASDPYVQTVTLKSVLCVPVVKQSTLVGILYLENRLVAGAFTSGQLGVLELIASQAAISIENAVLYSEMEDRVRLRTADLSVAMEIAKLASEAKSSFLANMSHEIRTPMNAILGFARSLRRTLHDPENLDKLDKIDQSSHHLLGIINDILDISKIEAGKMSLSPEKFSLSRLVQGVAAQVSQQAELKGLAVIVAIADDVPDHLIGDAQRISQCLLNYANNAIKFTQSGSISIAVSVQPSITEAVSLRFDVKDTGIGINAETIARLFSDFEQADQTTTRQFGGTGLGLAITKRFSALMGGDVGIDSVVGEGSVFWFTVKLAVADGTFKAPDASPAPLALLQNAKVLIAEDIALNREVLQDMLRESGVTCHMAENGQIAVDRARNAAFDLILMDMPMPVMDGLEATKAIRALPNYDTVPIVALTANAFAEDRERCLEAGMNDFLSKPLRPDMLNAIMSKWLAPRQDARAMTEVEKPAPPPDSWAHVKSVLGSLEDFDLARGMASSTKPERYIYYLQHYAESFDECMDRFRHFIQTSDRIEARRVAHSLRGASGQFGIVGLQDRAARLEQLVISASNEHEMMTLAHDIDTRLTKIIAAIGNLQGSES